MIVVTASIGGGIFSLSGDLAAGGANTAAVLVICFVSVFSLMKAFHGLSQARPDLTGGIIRMPQPVLATILALAPHGAIGSAPA